MTNKEIDTQARRVDDVLASAEHWRKVAGLTQTEIDALKARLAVAVGALEHTIHAAEYLYKPNAYLADGMYPTFYHTLTYAGDAALIEKTKKAREALATLKGEK